MFQPVHVPGRSALFEPDMNGDFMAPANRDAQLESLSAELAQAAYRIALRTQARGTWLDLELDLWRALADTVRTWRGNCPKADHS